ncbi:MAG: ElyC/SanA/YdcF family protein [Candidatus Aenigmatarchaeota archaeon]
MKIGIVHGAGINPDGSLQLHTKARADIAIGACGNSIIDKLIVCGENEADPITSYILNKGVDREKIMIEPFSYSTLSNLYYCKMLLSLLAHLEPVDKVYPVSSYWHIPRLSSDARKIFGEEYYIECLSADDPRNEEEVKRDKRLEGFKSISDKILLNLGYGKEFDRERFFARLDMITDLYSHISDIQREALEDSINLATPSYQRKLMKLEKMLYKVMKVV